VIQLFELRENLRGENRTFGGKNEFLTILNLICCSILVKKKDLYKLVAHNVVEYL